MTQNKNQALIDNLSADLQDKSDPSFAWSRALGFLMMLPAVRGVWPMSAMDSSGNPQDVSGHAHHLTYNGNPVYSYSEFAPYIILDGTGDYLDRSDESDLDILGTEAYISSPGLTVGGWFYSDDGTPASQISLISKDGAAGSRGWFLSIETDGTIRILVSSDGTATTVQGSTGTISDATWFFGVGRLDPSTELAIHLNGSWDRNTTSIPSAIFNNAAALEVGSRNGGLQLLAGRAALCFLCAAYLSDDYVDRLFRYTRHLFHI